MPNQQPRPRRTFDEANVHLSLGIPRGHDGGQGEQGVPGEISQATLDTTIAGTARNPSSVNELVWEPSDPPTADDFRTLRDNEVAPV